MTVLSEYQYPGTDVLKYAEIVRNSRTMILSIKMSTINLWTVLNPDEFIFPHAVTYGSKTLTAYKS
jgi:hypothetical protein